MNKILSICIASYNKAETTFSLVNSLLTCPNLEFEVVVVDNASTDDTVDRLNGINDNRLRVVRNNENIGGARNFLASMFEARGLFCFYTNDRDIVYPNKIDAFIEYLKAHSYVGGGHCVRNKINKVDALAIEHKKIDALSTVNFRGEHPTGFFFKRSLLNDVPEETLKDYGMVEPYLSFPWEGFLCEIICKGYTVVQYNDVIWQSTGDTTHSKYQSGYYINGEKEERWFFPKNRLALTIAETSETLRIARANGIFPNVEERYRIYAHLLAPQYTFAVYRYKVIYETPTLAYHYKVAPRKISKGEMNRCRKEMIDGYISYIREIEGGYNEKEKYIIDGMRVIDDNYRITLRRFLSKTKKWVRSLFKNN